LCETEHFGQQHVPSTFDFLWAETWAEKQNGPQRPVFPSFLAEAVRFELTDGFPSPVFKTGAIDHSATLPVPGF
jgi:hypothetical protein